MQQICRITLMPKCDFNKIATLLKSHFRMGVLLQISCIFSEHVFLRKPLEDCIWKVNHLQIIMRHNLSLIELDVLTSDFSDVIIRWRISKAKTSKVCYHPQCSPAYFISHLNGELWFRSDLRETILSKTCREILHEFIISLESEPRFNFTFACFKFFSVRIQVQSLVESLVLSFNTSIKQTRSRWRVMHLRSKDTSRLRENRNKEKKFFLKTASSQTLSRNASSQQEF